MFTVLFCGNASGEYLPPYVIYKGKGNDIMNTWMDGGPPNTCYNVTKSGWMEDYVFEVWFEQVFIEYLKDKEKPVIVFFDGHGSHLTYQTASKAKDENIHIICLPPKSSSALQPLDVACYGPAKKEWYKILTNFYRESRQKTVQKPSFPRLLKVLFEKAFVSRPQNLISGFRKTRLYPLNPKAVPEAKLVPSTLLQPRSPAADDDSSPDVSIMEESVSPHKALREAIKDAVCPRSSDSTNQALSNASRKRTRVQKKHGEVLTSESSLQRLADEEKRREEKRRKSGVKAQKCLINERICYECMQEDPPYDGSSSDEDEDVPWLGCESCGRWYHSECVQHLPYFCKFC